MAIISINLANFFVCIRMQIAFALTTTTKRDTLSLCKSVMSAKCDNYARVVIFYQNSTSNVSVDSKFCLFID